MIDVTAASGAEDRDHVRSGCLAQRLLETVMNMAGGDATGTIRKAKITVHKPNAPIVYDFEDVSVTVKAKRD